MKRIHLFEFEDFTWFPNWIRLSLTRLMIVMHKMLNSKTELAELLNKVLKNANTTKVIDLCSGSGGPMPEVVAELKENYGFNSIELTLTDLYPSIKDATRINAEDNTIHYQTNSVDATNLGSDLNGLRTMICSFHHMDKQSAHSILKSAFDDKEAICIFEISDNSYPKFLWWLTIPINLISCLFITPFVKPLSWYQLVFTYLIPIIPIFFAWDGAVSNARTYTIGDMEILIQDLQSDDYSWEMGTIKGKSKKLFLIGMPSSN